jgi:hypothetical protein
MCIVNIAFNFELRDFRDTTYDVTDLRGGGV